MMHTAIGFDSLAKKSADKQVVLCRAHWIIIWEFIASQTFDEI